MASGRRLRARGRRGRGRSGARGRLQPPRQALARDDHPLPQPRAEHGLVARAGRSGVEHERNAAPVREVLPGASPHRRPGRGGGGGLCRGQATAGYVPKAYGGGWAMVSRACGRFDAAGVLAHELGHVLGLGHEDRRCATMNSTLWWRCPNSPQLGQYRCRLVNTDDVRGAVRRYGGRVKPQGPLYCWKYPPPPAPGSVTADLEPAGRRRRAPPLEEHDVGGADRGPDRPRAGYLPHDARRRRGELERVREPGERPRRSRTSGAEPLETGTYCYALWSYDEADRTAGPTDGLGRPRGRLLSADRARRAAESGSGRLRQANVDELDPSAGRLRPDHPEAGELPDRSVRRRGRLARLRRVRTAGRRAQLGGARRRGSRRLVLRRLERERRHRPLQPHRGDGRRATSGGTGARARTARGRAREAPGRRPARGSRTRPCRRPSRPRGGSPSRAGRARRRGR